MGLLDGFLKQMLGGQSDDGGLGHLVQLVSRNPAVLQAVLGLLSTRDTAVGGRAGLGDLVHAFEKKGLGDLMSSWISTGPNPTISAAQLTDVLGDGTLEQFARKAGVPAGEAGSILAGLLPIVIDKLTPDGRVPESDSLESTLGSLAAGLSR